MLHLLDETASTTAALEQAIHVLRPASHTNQSEAPTPAQKAADLMSTDKPTIALVHGAFAESSSWNPVIERLHHHDPIPVASHDRPFANVVAIANPLRSLTGDAGYVRDVLSSIEGPIVLVGHSYGGMVITEGAAGNDAIVALVYVAAFAPEHGESAIQLSNMFPGSTLGDALSAYAVSTGGNELAIRQELFHHQFAADVPAEQAALMAATQRPVTQVALSDGLVTDRPAWKDIPSWFVYGGQDRNIPPEVARLIADRAGSKGTREVAGASHAISMSNPDAVAATILDAVQATALIRSPRPEPETTAAPSPGEQPSSPTRVPT